MSWMDRQVNYAFLIELLIIMGPITCGGQTSAAERPSESANVTIATPTDTPPPGVLDDESASPASWWGMADWPKEKKATALDVAILGTATVIGLMQWDYGSDSFHFVDEGWFGSDAPYGGADKLGHAFMAYAFTGAFNSLYHHWGYSEAQAIAKGATSTLLLTTMIEVGDGFSNSQGFSWQDATMNALGVGMGYLRGRYPSVREKVDFRLEWLPSSAFGHGGDYDPFTDYSGQKYLLAFKPEGFLKTGDPFWKALELHVGYYTRGYLGDEEDDFRGEHRYGYIGIGLNVTYLLERLTGRRAGGFFDYYQVPYTYISGRTDLD